MICEIHKRGAKRCIEGNNATLLFKQGRMFSVKINPNLELTYFVQIVF